MLKFWKFVAAALIAMPAAAFADGLSYNYVDAGYVTGGDDSVDYDGFDIKVSGKISDALYVFGGYASLESDTSPVVELDTISAGLGWRYAVGQGTDLNAEAAFVKADIDVPGFSDDDTGYGLGLGIRHMITPQLEVGGKVNYVDVFDEDGTSFTASGLFHVTPALSAGVAYSIDDEGDVDEWTFSGRFNF